MTVHPKCSCYGGGKMISLWIRADNRERIAWICSVCNGILPVKKLNPRGPSPHILDKAFIGLKEVRAIK